MWRVDRARQDAAEKAEGDKAEKLVGCLRFLDCGGSAGALDMGCDVGVEGGWRVLWENAVLGALGVEVDDDEVDGNSIEYQIEPEDGVKFTVCKMK